MLSAGWKGVGKDGAGKEGVGKEEVGKDGVGLQTLIKLVQILPPRSPPA